MQQHEGRLPKSWFGTRNSFVSTHDLTPLQQFEVRLARRSYYEIKKRPNPGDPSWEALVALYEKQTLGPVPNPEDFLITLQSWVAAHNGKKPRFNIYQNGTLLSTKQLKKYPDLYEEHILARRLDYLLRRGIANPETRRALDAIYHLPTIARWEHPAQVQFYDGFGNVLPSQTEFLTQLQAWVSAHGNKRPRMLFYKDKKRIPVQELKQNAQLYEEYNLGKRLYLLIQKGGQTGDLKKQLQHIHSLPVFNQAE